ncbi:MAG: tail fiber domain-containing protein [Nannocystaceae bacterium]
MDQEPCTNGTPCCQGLECCAGVLIPSGSEYCSSQSCPISDRNAKRDFAPIDGDAVLDTLATLPITTWSYRSDDPSIRHIGPMAQDFRAAFAVGGTDKAIFQVDADGVAGRRPQTRDGSRRSSKRTRTCARPSPRWLAGSKRSSRARGDGSCYATGAVTRTTSGAWALGLLAACAPVIQPALPREVPRGALRMDAEELGPRLNDGLTATNYDDKIAVAVDQIGLPSCLADTPFDNYRVHNGTQY